MIDFAEIDRELMKNFDCLKGISDLIIEKKMWVRLLTSLIKDEAEWTRVDGIERNDQPNVRECRVKGEEE